MATTHSSVLAGRIPGTGESGGLLFLGSHRVTTEATQQQQQQGTESRNMVLLLNSPYSMCHP